MNNGNQIDFAKWYKHNTLMSIPSQIYHNLPAKKCSWNKIFSQIRFFFVSFLQAVYEITNY